MVLNDTDFRALLVRFRLSRELASLFLSAVRAEKRRLEESVSGWSDGGACDLSGSARIALMFSKREGGVPALMFSKRESGVPALMFSKRGGGVPALTFSKRDGAVPALMFSKRGGGAPALMFSKREGGVPA